MNDRNTQTAGQLPSYITVATPNPIDKRAPWFKNTAPTYAGIFLWFVFWQDAAKAGAPGGTLSQGVGWALVGFDPGPPMPMKASGEMPDMPGMSKPK